MTFSEKLLRLRKARNMSQEELAERLEVSRQAISRWEMGTAMPDAVNILAISKLFGVTTDYLLYDEMERFEVPTVQSAPREKVRRFANTQYLLTVMVLMQVVLLFVLLRCVIFRYPVETYLSSSVLYILMMQVLAVVFFEIVFSKRNLPDIDHVLYHALYYRIAVWGIAYLPVCIFLNRAAISLFDSMRKGAPGALVRWVYQMIGGDVYLFFSHLVLFVIYLAVCFIVFFLCQRIIKRRRT